MSPSPERRRGGSERPRHPQAVGTAESKTPRLDLKNASPADLVDKVAEAWADAFGKDLGASQLRKFFGEVKDLYRRLLHYPEAERGERYRAEIEPLVKMLRSKAYYAKHKAGGADTVPQQFVDYIEGAVRQIDGPETFARFVQHFEAVVGFWFGKHAKKSGR